MPKKEKKKVTPEQVRTYVSTRRAKDASAKTGTVITGPDLALASKHIDLIPDKQIRKQVYGMLSTFEKYAALDMLLDPRGPYARKFPEIMQELAEVATEAERNFTVDVRGA